MRSGLAATAFGAGARGWAQRFTRIPVLRPRPEVDTGWSLVPGILASIVPPTFPARDFVITEFGASDETGFDSNSAINAAIMACSRSGGGRVVVPAGAWLSNGPLYLLSDVNLYLEAEATIIFSANPEDYLPLQLVRWQGIRCYNFSPLIYAYQQRNIALTGSGTLNGQAGVTWANWTDISPKDWNLLVQMGTDNVPVEERQFGLGHSLRPTFFEPYDCQNILVEGVTFEDSPFWTIHPTFCSNVTVQNVTVLPGAQNDDGCDPDSCQNVLITGCNFSTVDDNISLKAGQLPDAAGLPGCENIVVQNCNCAQSGFSALTIGTDAGGFISNVFMENCTVTNCLNAHYIKGWTNLGGGVENVYFRSNAVGVCHHLLTLQPDAYAGPGPYGPLLISNVNLQDVTCEDSILVPFYFLGDARLPIDEVNLSDVVINTSTVTQVAQIANTTDVNASGITFKGEPVLLEKLHPVALDRR